MSEGKCWSQNEAPANNVTHGWKFHGACTSFHCHCGLNQTIFGQILIDCFPISRHLMHTSDTLKPSNTRARRPRRRAYLFFCLWPAGEMVWYLQNSLQATESSAHATNISVRGYMMYNFPSKMHGNFSDNISLKCLRAKMIEKFDHIAPLLISTKVPLDSTIWSSYKVWPQPKLIYFSGRT